MPNTICSKDEAYFRMMVYKWERRFVDDSPVSIMVMIRVKDDFIRKYGIEETAKITNDVVRQVADELNPPRPPKIVVRNHHDKRY